MSGRVNHIGAACIAADLPYHSRPSYVGGRVHLPSLPPTVGNGARGWLRLAAIHAAYDLPDLPNPYAAGDVAAPYAATAIGLPDSMGYAVAAITDDGATLCHACATDPANPVHPADDSRDGWGIAGWTYSGEMDGPDWCDHCGRDWTGLTEDGEVDA